MAKDAMIEEFYKTEELKKKNSGETGIFNDVYYSISVTNYMQETSYWCGPASARQTLSFHKSNSGSSTTLPSQTTLANKIGTTTAGSTSSGIKNALNEYASTFSFSSYAAGDVTNTTNPSATFESRIKYALQNRTGAPITLIETKYLDRYNGTALRPYSTVSGYLDDGVTKQFRSVDPNHMTSFYGTYWDPMGSTTSNGIFRACYQADVNGTNLAMIY